MAGEQSWAVEHETSSGQHQQQQQQRHPPSPTVAHISFSTNTAPTSVEEHPMENGQMDPEAARGRAQGPKTRADQAGCASEPLLSKFIIDFVCLLIVWIPVLVLFLDGEAYHRGFYCNDEDIRHPFIPSTVPNWLLYITGGGLPILGILVIEAIHCRFNRSGKKTVVRHTFFNRQVHPYLWECYHGIGVFGFGAGCSQLFTDIAKYSIGRLRPHFISVCVPSINCTDPQFRWQYNVDFTCTGPDESKIHDARLSFPSGHSSFSFYTMVFLAIYLQARLTWDGSWLLRPLLQILAVCLAWGTALSRVSDYKHHWSDVLSGGAIGSFVAILTALYVSRFFRPKRPVHQSRFGGSLTSDDAVTLPLTGHHPDGSPVAPSGVNDYQSIQHHAK